MAEPLVGLKDLYRTLDELSTVSGRCRPNKQQRWEGLERQCSQDLEQYGVAYLWARPGSKGLVNEVLRLDPTRVGLLMSGDKNWYTHGGPGGDLSGITEIPCNEVKVICAANRVMTSSLCSSGTGTVAVGGIVTKVEGDGPQTLWEEAVQAMSRAVKKPQDLPGVNPNIEAETTQGRTSRRGTMTVYGVGEVKQSAPRTLRVWSPSGQEMTVANGSLQYQEDEAPFGLRWFEGTATVREEGLATSDTGGVVSGWDAKLGKWCTGPVQVRLVSPRTVTFKSQGVFAITDDAGQAAAIEEALKTVKSWTAAAYWASTRRPIQAAIDPHYQVIDVAAATLDKVKEIIFKLLQPERSAAGLRPILTNENRADPTAVAATGPRSKPTPLCPRCHNDLTDGQPIRWQGSTVNVCSKCAEEVSP